MLLILIVDLRKQIHDYLKSTDKSEIDNMLENQSYLVELANKIKNTQEYELHPCSEKTIKLDEIQDTLTSVNDLVRFFFILSNKPDMYFKNISLEPFLQNNIRLEVPVSNLTIEDMKEITISMGNLTVVDTPGPNEAGASRELEHIVKEEMRKAAIVVLVLDFTTMGTHTDQKILEEIVAIRKTKIDKDCIYVIVNKVDQRRQIDMTKDDVNKLIATKYRIEEKPSDSAGRRIFEMKGVHCLVCRRFMNEIEELKRKNKECVIKEMKTVKELIRELYPKDGGA